MSNMSENIHYVKKQDESQWVTLNILTMKGLGEEDTALC